MFAIRDMRPEEFPAYCDYFIADYGCEIAKNYGHSMDVAIELAKNDLHRFFPHGLDSKEHSLLCMEVGADGQFSLVGYLWHAINAKENSSFIYDLYVSDEYRGQGFAKQAISLLEKQLQSIGVNQLKLRVAYHNQRALELYQEVGFVITGFNMSKNLQNP